MNKTRKYIRHVFWIYALLFSVLVFSLGKYILFDAPGLVANSYNPRLSYTDNSVKRGEIRDSSGNVLAASTKSGNVYVRDYPKAGLYTHTVGYEKLGKAGLESISNFTLQTIDNEVWQRLNNIMNGEEIKANSIVLTLDSQLQKIAYDGIGKRKAAVVAMEPSTGKILAMVSSPGYDPNKVESLWSDLREDTDNNPLVNRATSGLYPPGSIFKLLTATAAMEAGMEDYEYNCKGEATFGDKVIHCFKNKAHGNVDLTKAITVSCNTYFSSLLEEMGTETLETVCANALFNTTYHTGIPHSKSSFTANSKTDIALLSQTAIGQGKTLVTPLHMAIVCSAVANGGIAMDPYMVDSVVTPSDGIAEKNMPKSLARIFSSEQANKLTEMMQSVVDKGTAAPIALKGIKICAKTGTAENEGKQDHGWLVAFAPAENPQIAISIVLENSDGPSKAMPVVKSMIDYWLNQRG